ncbi:MAG: hypothetical protein KDJ14_11805 [Xanthomonadales bacterium]|nr:hypothetical protein [Xanthomonadales bacterium]
MYRLIALALAMGGTQAVAASLEPLLPGCPYVETHELATLTPNSSRYQRFVTMVYRPDGRPVIAYAGGTSSEQSLHLILCDDVACTSRTDRELDTVFGYAAAPGLVLTSDGRPLLFADRFGTLRYYECHDTQCASFTPRTIESSIQGFARAMIMLPQDKPVMIYSTRNAGPSNWDIVARTCTSTSCESSDLTTIHDVDPSGDFFTGAATSAIDQSGMLALAFIQGNNTTANNVMRVLRCTNADCSTSTVNTVSTPQSNSHPERSSLQILADDRPLVFDGQTGAVATRWDGLVECADAACNSALPTPLTVTDATYNAGLILLDDTRPLIASFAANQVGFHVCDDLDCSTSSTYWAASGVSPSGLESMLSRSPEGRPHLLYFDGDGTKLNALTCAPITVFAQGFESP